jgi:hypothetical protein
MVILPKSFCCVAALQPTHDARQDSAMETAPKRHKDNRQAESRRILASVNDEMQVSGVGNQLANRVGGHFAARDADQADRVEVIGRRIGRFLSLLLCMGLIVWLALFVIGNAG